MTRLRRYLRSELKARVERNGIVVWVDLHGEYSNSAESVVPDGVGFGRLDGSFYALRRLLEDELTQANPRVVVYLDSEVTNMDPLEEARAAGREYRIRLGTLLKKSIGSELPSSKLDEIAAAVTSLSEAEALLEGGAVGGPARLVGVAGTSDATELVLKLAFQSKEVLAKQEDVRTEFRLHLESQFGIKWKGEVDELAGTIGRQLALLELREVLGGLPAALRAALPETTADQRTRCRSLLHRWRYDDRLREIYRATMRHASNDLDIAGAGVQWVPELAQLDTLLAYEQLALPRYLTLLSQCDYRGAAELAARRADSFWATLDAQSQWHELWSVARSIAELRLAVGDAPTVESVEHALRTYAEQTWRVDSAHRQLERTLISFVRREPLETEIRDARRAYDKWLDKYLRKFTDCLSEEGLDTGNLLRQARVHPEVVAPAAEGGQVGYFTVDALRFELGAALRDRLARVFPTAALDLRPAVALLPSITSVGMANLCPGADTGLRLELADGRRLTVAIDGQATMRPQDRVTRLRAAHGTVADLQLDDILRRSGNELDEAVAGANLVLVRSQEIDGVGESGKISASLDMFDLLLDHIQRAIARLSQHGIRSFVITADHGFVVLTRDLGPHMTIPKPGGTGDVHRRAFVGRGGASGDALVRIPISKLGLPGDLDVLVPRGLAFISAGGARGFFHGGASPQELLVPVLTIETEEPQGSTDVSIKATITPTITSQIFIGEIWMDQDLFSEPLELRVVPVVRDGSREVGTIVTTDAGDPAEGLIRLSPSQPASVGFRLTSSLRKGDRVVVRVFDARTDRLHATSKPGIAARDLEVDDEFS